MKIENDFIYFDKNDEIIIYNDITFNKPNHFNRAISRFRFNLNTNTIERFCSKCKVWYVVLNFSPEDSSLTVVDTHFHYTSETTGFNSNCKNCDNNSSISTKSNSSTNSSGDHCNLNISIPSDLKLYCKFQSYKEGKKLNAFITQILQEYKENNPFTI